MGPKGILKVFNSLMILWGTLSLSIKVSALSVSARDSLINGAHGLPTLFSYSPDELASGKDPFVAGS